MRNFNQIFSSFKNYSPPLSWIALIAAALCVSECYVPGASGWWFIGASIWFLYLGSLLTSLPMGNKLRRSDVIFLTPLLLISTLQLFDFPKRIAFDLSKSELDKFAIKYKDVQVDPTRDFLSRPISSRFRIGVLPVMDFYSDGKGSVFIVTGLTGYIDTIQCGYAYGCKPLDLHRTRMEAEPICHNWSEFAANEHF